MIKLNKIVLINWMYFQKAIFPIEGNVAIVGVNGTGKSTIMDAIQMLLLGQRASKFNSNANAEKRSLESYVRGHVNIDDKEFLRSGDVITYLALEIILNGEKHIFGLNIEYKANLNRLNDSKYFYVKNCELDESLFIEKNFPKTYDAFSKAIKANYEFIPYQTLMMYQNKLKEVLGLKTENTYFKILSRAVGIKNINDCNTFMNEFVLDDNPIDVSAIKDNIIKIQKVSQTIEKEQEKLNNLSEISEKGTIIETDIKNAKENELKILVASKAFVQQDIDTLESDNIRLNELKTEEEKKKTEIEKELKKLEESKGEHVRLLDHVAPNLSQKQKELESTRDEYNKVHLTLNTFQTKCKNELPRLSDLSVFKNNIIDDFILYIRKSEYTTASARRKFIDFRIEAKKIYDQYHEKTIRVSQDLNEVREKLKTLDSIIEKLRNNQPTYKPDLTNFIEYLKQNLYDKYKEKMEIKFLCEYLDITENAWRNAIEGYLGNQRFYIVVPNKYYKDAIKLYQAKKDFFTTRIINGSKLPDYEKEEGTLGEFIEASNSTALNYARYLLNRVHCMNDILELDKYEISITKDCMFYQGYSIGRINPRNYKESYIGQEGIKNQLKMRLEQKDELSELANDILGNLQKNNEYAKMMDHRISFATAIIEDNTLLSSIDEDVSLYNKIEKFEKEIDFYQSNPKYMEIQLKISETDESIKSNGRLVKNLDKSIIDHESSIKANKKTIDTKIESINQYNIELQNYSADFIDTALTDMKSIKFSFSMINGFKSIHRALETKILKSKNEIENLMKDARDKFNINYEPNFDLLDKFKEEMNKINKNVFQYHAKLIDISKNNRKLFFSQFLTKLYTSIEKAKEQIDNLNHSLASFMFGNDFYKIRMSISENKDMQTIYNYAKEYNSEHSDRGIFIDREIEDRERQKVQDLVNQYMFSDDIRVQNYIVDYRNYLYFDVENHTSNGIKSLNKVIKSQSGGEVQAPFYILSGVAFQQTLDYKRNKDALGIVLYDEAFDKMDDQRIQSMLEFYRNKLNLQLILATPGKLGSLVDNIKTVLTVVRDGEVATVSDISHEIR